MKENGLLIVYTGNGKGKTTAALGLALRALGWGKKVSILQFFKSEEFPSGERLFLQKQNIEILPLGIGYSWTKTTAQQVECLQKSWEEAKKKLADPAIDMVILDEVHHIFQDGPLFHIVPIDEFIKILHQRPLHQHVITTGRNAPDQLIEEADTVTEMHAVKHHFKQHPEAIPSIEY